MSEITHPEPYVIGGVEEKPREACGVFAIYDTEINVFRAALEAAYRLQHRGQEAAGITVSNGTTIERHVGVGLVEQVFKNVDEIQEELGEGHISSSHVRYGTLGAKELNEDLAAQPTIESLVDDWGVEHGFTMAHNGHFFVDPVEGLTDSKIVSMMIAKERKPGEDIEDTLARVLPKIDGAYSLAITTKDKVIGVRDPNGFRPHNLAKTRGGNSIGSEEPALKRTGGEILREIDPGEMIIIDEKGFRARRPFEESVKSSLCIMEFVYLANPKGKLQDKEVFEVRVESGKRLAERDKILHPDLNIDIVGSVPDSGTPAGIGYARASGAPYGIIFQKDRYTGRNFIQPGDDQEKLKRVEGKYEVIESEVEGLDVVLLDDSKVKSHTGKGVVKMTWEAGAKSVHLRIAAPPYIHACHMGLDTGNEDELIAAMVLKDAVKIKLGVDDISDVPHEVFNQAAGEFLSEFNDPTHQFFSKEIAKRINATTLEFLPIANLRDAIGETPGLCDACMTGDYPVPVPVSISGK